MTKKKNAKPTRRAGENEKTGVEYLGRMVKGSKRMSLEEKAIFAMAIEKGFAVGQRLQFMFALRDAVTQLQAVGAKKKKNAAIEFPQDDPVLHVLDEASDASKEFMAACGPLLDLLPQLVGPLEKLNAYLSENDVIANNPRSLTERQLVGIAIARTEKKLKKKLEPKEVVEFFNDIDLFDGKAPDADAWKEILWKSRGRTGEDGKTISDKNRGSLLSDLEFAAEKKAQPKKDRGP